MTAPELAAIVNGLAPAVRALVERELTKAVGDLRGTIDHQAKAIERLTTLFTVQEKAFTRIDERVDELEQTEPTPAPGPPGPPGKDGITAIRYVVPWQDGFEYQPGDFVAVGPLVYCCEKATTVRPGTVTRNAHGDVRGPQGKDFWALVQPSGRA